MNKKKEGLFKGASVAELYSKFGVVLILILCLIIGTILSPEFLTGSNLMSVARNVGVYAIIALGMTRLLIGGGVDLSAGSNVAFCSVIVAVIYAQTGSTLMAVIAAILCGMIIGAINGYFASYIGLMPFIVTLATQMTVRGLAYLVAGGAPVYGVSSSIVFLGQGNIRGFPMLLIVVLVATAIMLFVMTRTSHLQPHDLRPRPVRHRRQPGSSKRIRYQRKASGICQLHYHGPDVCLRRYSVCRPYQQRSAGRRRKLRV